MKQTNLLWSYIAGFLDADGSIYVRLKPNSSYKYGFQVSPSIIFFQKYTSENYLNILQQRMNLGYLRYRKDGIVELTIGDRKSIKFLLKKTSKFLLLKKKQAELMLRILNFKVHSAQDFLYLANLIDSFGELNYSKKRSINSKIVSAYLIQKGLLTP